MTADGIRVSNVQGLCFEASRDGEWFVSLEECRGDGHWQPLTGARDGSEESNRVSTPFLERNLIRDL